MSFKNRLVLVVSFMTVALACVMFLVGRADKSRTEKGLAAPVNKGKHYAWQMALQKSLADMKKEASNLEMAFEIKSALKKGDSKELKAHADVFFDLVKDQGFLSVLQLTDSNGKILYSAPETLSGQSNQQSVRKAIESLEIASELEYDHSKNLVLSLAIPIKSRDKLYGIGVYNLNMEAPARFASQQDESEVFVVSPGNQLIAGTAPSLFSDLNLQLPGLGGVDLFSIRRKDAAYSVAVQPILSVQNTPLAHLVSLTDVTEDFAKSRQADSIFLVILVATVGLTILGLEIFIRRSMKPIETSVRDISAVANGDLTRHFRLKRKDEFGKLMAALGKMTRDLRRLFRHIAASGTHLAENASVQAASIEEISGSLKNMEEMTRSHANDARDGDQRISEVNQAIRGTEDQMGRLQALAKEMSGDSQKIQSIVRSIDDIASQTRLLALNASVEAARAGEAGAGFSVVASEVENLSSRTAQLAKEISTRIEQTVEKIGFIDDVSEEADRQFQLIFAKMSKLSTSMEHIKEGSLEQASRITALNSAVDDVNRVVRETAIHADELIALLDRFKFDETGSERSSDEETLDAGGNPERQ
jgi:methyl-accepting chemotaxis protein